MITQDLNSSITYLTFYITPTESRKSTYLSTTGFNKRRPLTQEIFYNIGAVYGNHCLPKYEIYMLRTFRSIVFYREQNGKLSVAYFLLSCFQLSSFFRLEFKNKTKWSWKKKLQLIFLREFRLGWKSIGTTRSILANCAYLVPDVLLEI